MEFHNRYGGNKVSNISLPAFGTFGARVRLRPDITWWDFFYATKIGGIESERWDKIG